MKLENQVVSLEIARKIEKLGVKQDSLWYWCQFIGHRPDGEDGYVGIFNLEDKTIPDIALTRIASAFTVAELGEMLPEKIKTDNASLIIYGTKRLVYTHNIGHKFDWLYSETASTEADARGKMLIYLIDNKLIEVAK